MEERVINLSERYEPIFKGIQTPILILTGGRGGGKSYAASLWAEDKTFDEGERILYTRFTMASADISIKDEYMEKVELMGHLSAFDVTHNRITNLQTGSDIIFRGLKTGAKTQTAALKSIKDPTVWILEEADELPSKQEFNKVRRSVRKKGVKILTVLIFNPPTREHWLWKEFFEGKHRIEYHDGYPVPISTDQRVTHIHTTYMDNVENLNEDFLQDAEYTKDKNPEEYAKDFIGVWGIPKTGQEFYANFSEALHCTNLQYYDYLPLHVSLDQNVVPYIAASIWQTFEDNEGILNLCCIDEIALENPCNTTAHVAGEIKARYGDEMETLFFYGDASGNKRDTRSKLTDYDIFSREMRPYLGPGSNRVNRSNPNVAKRGEFIGKIFKGDYPVKIWIDAQHCPKMVLDLQMVKQDPNRGKSKHRVTQNGVSFEQYGHLSDTLDYFVCKVLEGEYRAYSAQRKRKIKAR